MSAEFIGAIFLNPAIATAFYTVVISVVVALTWVSGDTGLRKTGLLMFSSWSACNVLFHLAGPDYAPWFTTSVNALVAVGLASTAIRHQCSTAPQVCISYCLEFGIIGVAFLAHKQGGVLYYAILNAVFLARAWIAGKAGYVELVDRVHSRDERARDWSFGGAGH